MAVSKAEFQNSDLFIDYEIEQVMFRYDGSSHLCYRKFYGSSEESQVPFDNRLLTDATLEGDKITAAVYKQGKSRVW